MDIRVDISSSMPFSSIFMPNLISTILQIVRFSTSVNVHKIFLRQPSDTFHTPDSAFRTTAMQTLGCASFRARACMPINYYAICCLCILTTTKSQPAASSPQHALTSTSSPPPLPGQAHPSSRIASVPLLAPEELHL